MLKQKGFNSLKVIAILALLGIGFYAGVTSQKSILSNIVELLQSPKPSINPSAELTPTNNPKTTPKPSSMIPITDPTSKPTVTSSPSTNPESTPSLTPTSTPSQSSTNTSNPNAPTFIKVSSPNGGESFKVGDSIHITWSSNNLNKNGSCIITLAYDNGSKSSAWVPVNTPNGYFDWRLSSGSGGRQVKVDMDCYDSNSNNAHDQSDNFFTVTN